MPAMKTLSAFVALFLILWLTVMQCYGEGTATQIWASGVDFAAQGKFKKAKEKVKMACSLLGRKKRILRIVKCGQQSARVYRICVDVKVY